MNDELDFDLLGLQWELQSYLHDHDLVWFVDYNRIEVDIGNAELKIELRCDWNQVEKVFTKWGKANGFKQVFYSKEKGAVYMRRRVSK